MKKYSIISSLIFIILTIVFYKLPRTENEAKFLNQTQIGNNNYFMKWDVKTTQGNFISPTKIKHANDSVIYLGKEVFGNDVVYFAEDNFGDYDKTFVKGISTDDYSYVFISLLIGLQFFILIGMNEKKELNFINAFCVFLMICEFLYMLRLFIM